MAANRPDSYRAALKAITRTLDAGKDNFDQNVTEAVTLVVRIRNELIEMNRAAPSDQARAELRRINAIVSLMAGGEFGKNTKRIEQARDALHDIRKRRLTPAGHPPG